MPGQMATQMELGPPLIVAEPPGAALIGPQPREAYSTSWIDTSDRNAVREAYNTILVPTVGVAVGWTGSVAGNIPGTTSFAYTEAALTRVNWFRAMAGVPAAITWNGTYSSKAQKAALIMSSNNALSHTPPADWLNWTQDGYDAAGASNLCMGTSASFLPNDPGCVKGYIDDNGGNNAAVGHRRWILVPQAQQFGTGDVTTSGPGYPSANALWVQDHFGSPRPATRDTFVAWPPKGYVPYQVVPARWSVSYANANFTNATVTMTSNGVNVSLSQLGVEPSPPFYIGENTLVWEPSISLGPGPDRTVNVTVTGVTGYPGGSTIQYSVIVFNPAQDAGLAAPVLLSPANGATGVSTSGLELTWNESSGAASYDIYLGTTSPPPFLGNTSSTSVLVSGVQTNTTYYWSVTAKDGATTASSGVWSFTTGGTAPAAPVLVSPANTATGVPANPSLVWNAASGATSYDVYVGTVNPPGLLTNTTDTAYSPALTSSTTYYWKVVAKNASGSTPSATWSFTTAASGLATPVLNTPGDGATGVSTSSLLAWSTVPGATSYDVYFGAVNPPAMVANTSALTYAPSLAAATTYYWKIVAKNISGSSTSAVWSFTTASGGPGAVTLLSPMFQASSVPVTGSVLTWNGASGATSYDVFLGTTTPPPLVGNTASTNWNIGAALTAGTLYYWQVVAKNANGTSSSAVWTFGTAPLPGPGPFTLSSPTNGQTNVARTNLTFTWTASANATSYDFYLGAAVIANVTQTNYTMAGPLASNLGYSWQVIAKNATGTAASPQWTFTTGGGTVPGPFTLLSPADAATGVTGGQLNWSAAADATSYAVYFGTTQPPPFSSNAGGTSVAMPGTLVSNTTYYWYVLANGTGGTRTSPTWSFTAGPAGPPAPTLTSPMNTSIGMGLTTALSWQPVSGAASYDVYFGTANPPPLVTNTTALTYSPGGLAYGNTYYWKIAARNASGATSSGQYFFATAASGTAAVGLRFVPLTPCRLVDTRTAYAGGRTGSFGPPLLTGGTTRTIPILSSTTCTVPPTAKAYVLNLTLDTYENSTGPVDFVTLWPAGETRPDFYTARTTTGGYIANAAIVKAGTNGAINAYASSDVNFILDISGYFTDDAASNGLLYYPVNPCRAVDTRGPVYSSLPAPYGNSRMQARENRSFRLPGSPACSIPAAAAYSMQLTLAPGELTNGAPVAFITAYPTGVAQPNISNMNALFGYAVANSAIVPANGSGSIDVFAYDATNLIIDVNGYFAPDDGTGRGLFYFPTTQCRVVNTQDAVFTGPYGGPALNALADRTVNVTAGRCGGLPATAKAWAVNASVVPGGNAMPYLSMWPSGTAWPNVSQLNAFQGQTLANSGIVPASSNGSIDVRVAGTTNGTLEVSGYFGR
ncbi:MAG: hypothetical protein HY820_01650 [Acidobacteria bacterium]|nr:hypothetical protein [Acidobacteriota bacterium]